jgi:hypothetical protein
MTISDLKVMLASDDAARGIACSSRGEIVEFRNPGVADLFNLVDKFPHFLERGLVADRVIGRGAALLLVKAGVTRVFASIMSEPAREVLRDAGIDAGCDRLVPNIINRTGTGICPVEQLTASISNPAEAMDKIRLFLTKSISK